MSNIYVIDKISLEKSSSVMKETSSLLRYRNTKSKDLCLNFILSPFATPKGFISIFMTQYWLQIANRSRWSGSYSHKDNITCSIAVPPCQKKCIVILGSFGIARKTIATWFFKV